MRKTMIALVMFILAAPAWAQRVTLDFPASLADKASEVVDVTLDGPTLKLAAKFLNGDADERNIRDMVQKLEGIYVRSFTFDKEGEYDRSVLDRVRAQLGPQWKKIVSVRGLRENSEVYLDMKQDGTPTGLVVMTSEPRELTVVNIVGPIDIDKLANLEGEFGIPGGHRKERHHDK